MAKHGLLQFSGGIIIIVLCQHSVCTFKKVFPESLWVAWALCYLLSTPRPLAPVLSLFLSLSPPQYTHCPGRCLDSFRDSINKETMKETWSYLIADVAQSCFRLFSNRPMVMRSVHGQYFDAVRSVYTDCLESESKSAQPKRFELIVNKWQCSQKLCIQNNSRQVNASPRWGHSISRHVDVLIRSNYEVNHSKS